MQDPDLPVIGHVVDRLDEAGAAALAAQVAFALGERFRFVFLCLGPTGELGQRLHGQRHKVLQLRCRPPSPFAVPLIARAIRRHGIDLLHAHQFGPYLLAGLGRLLVAGGPPMLMTDHGRPVVDGPRARRALAHRLLLRPGDQVVAATNHIRDALRDFDGLAGRQVAVIPAGIDPDRFDADDPEARPLARRLMGLDDQVPVVIQVARFSPAKDQATAVRAFARLHDRMPDARLVLVGDGPTRPAVRQLAWEQGVLDHTCLLGDRDDVDALLPGADVFMLSSRAEGAAPAVLEAMASGLPVVATGVGGVAEVVVHGQCGLLCPAGDHAALAHNLGIVLRDRSLAGRMGAAGRRRVLDGYTRGHMLEAYAAMYRQMLG